MGVLHLRIGSDDGAPVLACGAQLSDGDKYLWHADWRRRYRSNSGKIISCSGCLTDPILCQDIANYATTTPNEEAAER